MANQKVQFEIAAVDNASKEIKKVEQSVTGLGNTFKSTFWAIAAYDIGKTIAIEFFNIGKGAIDLASNLEQTRIAFTTMTGDARIADAFIREMTAFAKTTPFEIGQLETASKQLLAYGIEVQNVLPSLKMLGDISAGVGMDKLPQLILAFGQVSAATKLTGNELRQFTEAGVPLLDELSKVMWKPVAAIQEMVSNWEIGFPIVQKALENLTKEGWRFENLMDKQSKSFWGMISNFKDTITILLRDLGTEFLPGMKKILDDVLKFWDQNGKQMAVSFSGFVHEIFTFFSDGMSGIAEVFSIVFDFFKSENKDTTGWLALSWKNWFLYLQEGLMGISLVFKTLGAYIVYQLVNAAYSSQIAWAKFKAWFWLIAMGIVSSIQFVGGNIGAMISGGVGLAIQSLNWLIDELNAIPGISIDQIGKDFTAQNAITFSEASKMAWDLIWVNENMLSEISDLEKQKADVLKGIQNETKDMVLKDLDKMSEAYIKFTQAQGRASDSGKTLKQVLEEIGKVGKKGPTWAPGWDKGKGKSEAEKALDGLKKLGEETASSLESIFSKITTKIGGQQESLKKLRVEYDKLKDKLKEVADEGVKELAKIEEQLKKNAQKIEGAKSEGELDIAKRAVTLQGDQKKNAQDLRDLEAEKAQFMNTYVNDYEHNLKKDEIDKRQAELELQRKKIEEELKLAQAYVTKEQIATAAVELAKSETQLIIDKTQKKMQEWEAERIEIQKTYDEKKAAIDKETADIKAQMDQKQLKMKEEQELYKALIRERATIEWEYFKLFQKNIADQINKTKEAIALINELNAKSGWKTVWLDWARADGGPVISGWTYLVGERGPEIFSPKSSGYIIPNDQIQSGSQITVNFGWITVNNKADADYLAEKVIEKITRQTQLYKLWIS